MSTIFVIKLYTVSVQNMHRATSFVSVYGYVQIQMFGKFAKSMSLNFNKYFMSFYIEPIILTSNNGGGGGSGYFLGFLGARIPVEIH